MTSEVKLHEQRVIQQGDITCYVSAKFFPRPTRQDILKIYFFLQALNDCADAKPQRRDAFERICQAWDKAKNDPAFDSAPAEQDTIEQRSVKHMVSLSRDYKIQPSWFDRYLRARGRDFDPKASYQRLQDTRSYLHDTAEMIALVMCKVMQFDPVVYPAAQLEARAIQYLNFIRDIAKYNQLGRCYIPLDELQRFGLADASEQTARANPKAFRACIRAQIDRYEQWQMLAREDLVYVPKECKVSISTVLDMNDWTAATIRKDPLVIFKHQVKPTKHRVLVAGFSHMLNL